LYEVGDKHHDFAHHQYCDFTKRGQTHDKNKRNIHGRRNENQRNQQRMLLEFMAFDPQQKHHAQKT